MGTTVGEAFEGHVSDAWGVGFIVSGLIFGLAIYLDTAGPLGEFLRNVAGAALGMAKVIVPIGLVLAGFALIRSEGSTTRTKSDRVRVSRMVVGAGLVLASLVGLFHIFGGRPGRGDDIEAFGDAGGFVGYALGGGLAELVAVPGATIVLVALGLLAVIVLTQISPGLIINRSIELARDGFGWVLGADAEDDRDDHDDIGFDHSPPITIGGEPAQKVAEIDLREDPYPDGRNKAVAPEPEAATEPEPAPEPKKRKAVKAEVPETPEKTEQLEMTLRAKSEGDSKWKLPSPTLLGQSLSQEVDSASVEAKGRELERALAAHGVETRLVGMVVGPTVTRYELELGPGVKVNKVTSLNKDIAYSLAAADVRILAPIPGRQAIGVEVPNASRQIVALGDILNSPEARAAKHPLEVAVGRDINGRSVLMNLAKMPHILIAGQTGAGKSSGLNSIITSILMRSTPEEVRMILIDPKMVEMTQYERVPHLLTQPVTDPKKAANALQWACREMDRRYELLSECGYRDLAGYNKAQSNGKLKAPLGAIDADGEPKQYPHMPFILVVVDELADLMMVAARDVEESICRIAQKARAVGIHLVIATQRPSTNVITGLIKANVPARIAFSVSSNTDSRVILDQQGAERLVGRGDLLLVGGEQGNVAHRIQGCWVEEDEVREIVQSWRDQVTEVTSESAPIEVTLDSEVIATAPAGEGAGFSSGGDGDDELINQAIELVVNSQLGSTSMLQRKLKVGFARAGRIMDELEEKGIVGPSTGSKAREVLISPEELNGGETTPEADDSF